MSEYKRLEEAIENIQSQYRGIDYSKGKDMTAICLYGDQAEEVIKVLSEYKEIAKAKAEGRLVVLPTAEEDDYEGLKGKYHVFKVKDNTPVYNCFVLRPQKDKAAVAALRAYADTCENEVLSNDILGWLRHIETEKQVGGGQDG